MALNPELLKIIVCPKCKGELEMESHGEEEGALLCRKCSLSYSIRNGIPIMITTEATKIGE